MDLVLNVSAGETIGIPFEGEDPDGDLFGFILTSGLSDPDAGTLLSLCFCQRTLEGDLICACSSTLTASETFSGTVTITYRAVDATGLQSADATATIHVSGARSVVQILDELEHEVQRAVLGGLIRDGVGRSLLSRIERIRCHLSLRRFLAAGGEAESLCREIASQAISEPIRPVLVTLCTGLKDGITALIQEAACHRGQYTPAIASRALEVDGVVRPQPAGAVAPQVTIEFTGGDQAYRNYIEDRASGSDGSTRARRACMAERFNRHEGNTAPHVNTSAVKELTLIDGADPDQCCHGFRAAAVLLPAGAWGIGHFSNGMAGIAEYGHFAGEFPLAVFQIKILYHDCDGDPHEIVREISLTFHGEVSYTATGAITSELLEGDYREAETVQGGVPTILREGHITNDPTNTQPDDIVRNAVLGNFVLLLSKSVEDVRFEEDASIQISAQGVAVMCAAPPGARTMEGGNQLVNETRCALGHSVSAHELVDIREAIRVQ